MKDYNKRVVEFLMAPAAQLNGNDDPYVVEERTQRLEAAKLEDEKRIFDLRFQAACAAIAGICANDACLYRLTTSGHLLVESNVAVSRAALAQADELLKQMGVTE